MEKYHINGMSQKEIHKYVHKDEVAESRYKEAKEKESIEIIIFQLLHSKMYEVLCSDN